MVPCQEKNILGVTEAFLAVPRGAIFRLDENGSKRRVLRRGKSILVWFPSMYKFVYSCIQLYARAARAPRARGQRSDVHARMSHAILAN
jgi:hypothetical protein